MNQIIEEDDINLFGVDDDDFKVHYDKKQGLYTPYDDKRDDNENYYQNMENAITEPRREYDLRSKSSQQTPNNKTSKKYSQNNTATKPKVVKQKDKTMAVNSDKGKGKSTQNNEDFEIHYDRKQGLYTPYDDKRDDDGNFYQDMENVIIEPQREYDLRSKTSQQPPNNKTFDESSKNSTATKTKKIKPKGKSSGCKFL